MKRRKFIRITSYLLAICVVVTAWGYFSQRAKASYETTLERVRFESLNSLCEYMNEISSGLSLLAVSTDTTMADSAGYVNSRSVGAMGCTACFDNAKSENINRFLECVYSFSQDFSGDKQSRSTATRLSDYAEEMYYHLSDLSVAVMNGAYTLSEYGSVYMKNEMPYFENYLDYKSGNDEEIFALTASVASTGHYSVLEDKESITLEEAKKIASGIAVIDTALWRENEKNNEENGIFSLSHGDTQIDICKKGGLLVKLIASPATGEAVFSAEEAKKLAEEFSEGQGYSSLVLVGEKRNIFSDYFCFVPEVNGVLLMTSQIEISVSLSNGEITYFDAEKYLRSYRDDIFYGGGIPDISNILPENVSAKSVSVCFAEIDGRERLCFLAVCDYNGEEVWVYIDVSTLKVVKTIIYRRR